MRIEEAFQLGQAFERIGGPRNHELDVKFMQLFRQLTRVGDKGELGAALRSSFYAGFDNPGKRQYFGDYTI